jgi:hypothetical protein
MTRGRPPLTIEDLLASPDHYLFAFDGDNALFAAMDREAYHRSIFLDRRISPAAPETVAVPIASLAPLADDSAAAEGPGWIFHVAHCGSTLLARGLDLPERSLVLREPLALRQLALERAQSQAATGDWGMRLRLVASLAGRRYRSDAPAIVKGNVPVNFIAADLLGLQPTAPAIFLYFPFRAYLLAILRSPHHRNWVLNVTGQMQPALVEWAGEVDGLGPAERAAALWLAQMRLFADAIARFPGARSLDADALFDAPRQTLAAAAAHLGIAAAPEELDAMVAGDLFATYSKVPTERFSNADRLQVQAETLRRLGPEMDAARRWLDRRMASRPLPLRLDRPLTSASPLLIDG